MSMEAHILYSGRVWPCSAPIPAELNPLKHQQHPATILNTLYSQVVVMLGEYDPIVWILILQPRGSSCTGRLLTWCCFSVFKCEGLWVQWSKDLTIRVWLLSTSQLLKVVAGSSPQPPYSRLENQTGVSVRHISAQRRKNNNVPLGYCMCYRKRNKVRVWTGVCGVYWRFRTFGSLGDLIEDGLVSAAGGNSMLQLRVARSDNRGSAVGQRRIWKNPFNGSRALLIGFLCDSSENPNSELLVRIVFQEQETSPEVSI